MDHYSNEHPHECVRYALRITRNRLRIDKSIDPDSRDMTAFAALYSPRHRWWGTHRCAAWSI
ncbi:MAG: hypothetical protein K2L45_03835 [Muribaculaceae bacterium]|nr:hypothetical protein [Muribaculaceae bacterium]